MTWTRTKVTVAVLLALLNVLLVGLILAGCSRTATSDAGSAVALNVGWNARAR